MAFRKIYECMVCASMFANEPNSCPFCDGAAKQVVYSGLPT